MMYCPAHMLAEIDRNMAFVPPPDRAKLAPVIGAMHAGQVTPLDDALRTTIHRTFVLYCVSDVHNA